MTRFDLHPEDLIERAQRGTLGSADLARLEQHLAECAVCRVERALRTQAAQDTVPLRDEQLLLARIKRDVSAELRAPSARRAPKKRAAAGLVLLAASIASAAAAATTFVVIHRQHRSELQAPAPPRVSLPPPPASITPPAPPAEAAAPEPVPAPTSAEPAAKPAALEIASAAEAFSRANQARRDGQSKDAVRLYRALQERFPSSSEALVSRVALGRLLLDRLGDSRGALVQFTSYLASPGGGALREEALVGRALALGKLGQRADERNAWQALLQAAPRSAYAERARARLAELGGSGGNPAAHAAEPGAAGPR
jgi:TolA-binding protein